MCLLPLSPSLSLSHGLFHILFQRVSRSKLGQTQDGAAVIVGSAVTQTTPRAAISLQADWKGASQSNSVHWTQLMSQHAKGGF